MSFRTQLRTRQAQVFRFGHLVSVLQMSAAELDEHLAETAQDNPFLVLRSRRSGGRSLVSTTEILETVASDQATSLQDHVLRQLAGPISRGGNWRGSSSRWSKSLSPAAGLAARWRSWPRSLAWPKP